MLRLVPLSVDLDSESLILCHGDLYHAISGNHVIVHGSYEKTMIECIRTSLVSIQYVMIGGSDSSGQKYT